MTYLHTENLGDIPRKPRKPKSLCKAYFARQRKAYKQHACYECELPVDKDEIYIESTYKRSGRYKIKRRHHWCFKWMRTLNETLGTTQEHEELSIPQFLRRFGEVDVLEEAPPFLQQWFRAKKKDEFIPNKPIYSY